MGLGGERERRFDHPLLCDDEHVSIDRTRDARMTVDDHLDRYTALLRDLGAIRTEAVARAFRVVRRDRCMTYFYPSPTGRIEVPQDTVPPAAVLDLIYRDSALPTRRRSWSDAVTWPSASLVARMLEALELQPGHRVLQVGAGDGYGAALLATITGSPVVSIDGCPDVVFDVQAAMRRLGMKNVIVGYGETYHGAPSQAPYHRVVVTGACDGVSPCWVDQLDEDGMILAPAAHGGARPMLAVRADSDGIVGRPVLWTDRTEHDGRLGALTVDEYAGLHFFLAVREPKIDHLRPRLFGNEMRIDRLCQEWDNLDRPRITDWECRLVHDDHNPRPTLIPARWRLRTRTR